MIKNKRFFAYGCSFTNYSWPTWADIIGRKFDQYYNYGQYGAGNEFIFNAVMETDQYHKFNDNDVVIIQWSSINRDDIYKNNNWITSGNCVNLYSEDDFEKFFDLKGFLIRDIAMIKATKLLLEYKNCEHYFISMNNFELTNSFLTDIYNIYKDIFDSMFPSFETILGKFSNIRPKTLIDVTVEDYHPLPSEHLKYLKNTLSKFFDDNDDKHVEQIEIKLNEIWTTHHQGWTYSWPDKEKGKQFTHKRL